MNLSQYMLINAILNEKKTVIAFFANTNHFTT